MSMCFDHKPPTQPPTPPRFIYLYQHPTQGVSFVLPTYSWVWDHILDQGLPMRGHPLKDNSLSLPRSHQLLKAPQL